MFKFHSLQFVLMLTLLIGLNKFLSEAHKIYA